MKKFSFDVEGEPKGKARPRFARIENTVRTYTPKTTQEYEKKIAQAFIAAGGTIFDYPYLKVKIAAYFPIPKSVRKSDRLEMEAGGRWHNKKPDCDNVAKAVLDALNNVAWVDDKQIVELSILKVYSKYPRITVTIVETV